MMARKSVILYLVLTFCITFILCFNFAQAQSKDPIKIGLLTPFSPPGDPAAGKRIRWGAELAIKYINEEMGGVLCGRPVSLAVEDDAGQPSDGIAGFRRLVQQEKVVAVLGQYHSSVCIALVKLASDLEVPLFSTGAASAKITESESPYIFSIMSLTPSKAEFWVDFAKQMGWKKIAVLAEDTDFGTDHKTWVEKYGEKAGVEIKSVIFPRTLVDLTPMLLQVKTWNPDVIINAGVPPTAYLMVKQAYEIGLFPKTPMIATYSWVLLPEFWDAVGDKGKYILFTTYYKPGMMTTFLGEWMIKKYTELYKEDPTYYALNAFGETMVIAQAVNSAQSEDPKKVAKALIKWPYLDWSGVVEFKEEKGSRWHNVSPPYLMFQVTAPKQEFKENKLLYPPKFGGDAALVKP